MSEAWEWRGFRGAGAAVGLLEMAAAVARSLDLAPPDTVVAEADTYLVTPGLRHNLKLRRGALEIKVQVARLPDGFSLWQDKEVWAFPLGQDQAERLGELLPGRWRLPPADLNSPGELVSALREQQDRMAVIPVVKRRVRMGDGGARLELADLELPGAFRWLSVCADGYDLGAVRELVRRSRLRTGARVMSYVDLLQEAVWWFPSLVREVPPTVYSC